MNNQLQYLKNDYLNTAIPKELDFVVRRTIKNARKANQTKKDRFTGLKIAAASVAAVFVVITVSVNLSPALAANLSEVPVIGSIIKVLTVRDYKVDDASYNMNAQVPAVSGLENETLKDALNEKYLEENKKLYEQFIADMEKLKYNGGGSLGIDSGYEVMTDNDRILSIGRYVVNTVGSSSTTFRYDTIDKIDGILITLPSLFNDETYIDIISKNIKNQMIKEYNADSARFYWVEGIDQQFNSELFERIREDQNFYIDEDGKLVISFDKYEVGPGTTGTPRFVIPTEILADVLVSNAYIK